MAMAHSDLPSPERHPAEVLREEQERRETWRRETRKDSYYTDSERRGRREAPTRREMWRGRGRGREGGQQDQRQKRPGFGDLCRYYHKYLRRQMDDHKAYEVRTNI